MTQGDAGQPPSATGRVRTTKKSRTATPRKRLPPGATPRRASTHTSTSTSTRTRTSTSTRTRRQHHHVYVVELDDAVWNSTRFRKANPNYQLGKPFVYVGMTGLDPDVRFDKHKAGIQSNSYVLRFGLRLLPGLYAMYNPMPYEGARDMEVELGIALREAGYGVWQG